MDYEKKKKKKKWRSNDEKSDEETSIEIDHRFYLLYDQTFNFNYHTEVSEMV